MSGEIEKVSHLYTGRSSRLSIKENVLCRGRRYVLKKMYCAGDTSHFYVHIYIDEIIPELTRLIYIIQTGTHPQIELTQY